MIRKTILVAALMLAPFFTQAHEIKKTGTFDILLHRDPDDNPIARQDTGLYFSVTDSREKFTFKDCDCKVAIRLGDETLLDRKLTINDEAPDWGVNVSRVIYVFPRLGVYVVTIEGVSKSGLYPAFKLDYDVRVERESDAPVVVPEPEPEDGFLQNYYVIGGVVIVSGIIIYELLNRIRKKK